MTKKQVNEIMQLVPLDWRYYWCEAQICGCLGCANRSGGVKAKGVTKQEWEQWVIDNPKPKVAGINCSKPIVWKGIGD